RISLDGNELQVLAGGLSGNEIGVAIVVPMRNDQGLQRAQEIIPCSEESRMVSVQERVLGVGFRKGRFRNGGATEKFTKLVPVRGFVNVNLHESRWLVLEKAMNSLLMRQIKFDGCSLVVGGRV